MTQHTDATGLGRRAFLKNGALVLATTAMSTRDLFAKETKPSVKVGLVTDMHYADKKPAGSRHYRETLAKLEEAAMQFQQDQPDHIVELGDFIDAADSVETEKGYLKRVNKEFAALPGQKHYVLGNHCVHTLTKDEFLDGVGQENSHYSFDAGGFHFVVLDACFRSDGKPYGRKNFKWTDPNIPKDQVEWLSADLKQASGKAVVFIHQRLDVSNNYGVKNAAEVRKVLEESGQVLAVFQGHSHKNDLKEINGIHYCVQRAMVEGSGTENNGYSTMDVFTDGTIRLTGFHKQHDYEWTF
ncbi:Calcineurin-like phosphoesterase superfamily domain protein [Thalassoglobus neptunius]|uniref:Calcineurin-like phosphoesterase superfamily domain protein n=1 Tax=Thalassoglobus neptunius TaxID=1938619 RepID=A0A5C5X5M6_9PLAN|nr:metallophosphoesterase [Thalassoglobus neptunius]TWT58326.1 Calcineurin-like phosphoesterase superfamily domain protein [Thalassoglobus neptunius]